MKVAIYNSLTAIIYLTSIAHAHSSNASPEELEELAGKPWIQRAVHGIKENIKDVAPVVIEGAISSGAAAVAHAILPEMNSFPIAKPMITAGIATGVFMELDKAVDSASDYIQSLKKSKSDVSASTEKTKMSSNLTPIRPTGCCPGCTAVNSVCVSTSKGSKNDGENAGGIKEETDALELDNVIAQPKSTLDFELDAIAESNTELTSTPLEKNQPIIDSSKIIENIEISNQEGAPITNSALPPKKLKTGRYNRKNRDTFQISEDGLDLVPAKHSHGESCKDGGCASVGPGSSVRNLFGLKPRNK